MQRQIPEGLVPLIPNYHRLGVRELIYYFNLNRTLSRARSRYIPSAKINTPPFYIEASQSKTIIVKEKWNGYCMKAIETYEIRGDHYSIFKMPQVVQLAKLFDEILAGVR